MSFSIEKLEQIVTSLGDDLAKRVYLAFQTGEPVDTSYHDFNKLLLDHEDVEKFIDGFKTTLQNNFYSGIYAIVGEYGTGKTQYGYFLKEALEDIGIEVIYEDISFPKKLKELRKNLNKLFLDETKKFTIILDGIDAYLSNFTSEEDIRRAAGELATLVETAKSRGFTSIVFLIHQECYETLQRIDERLRRITKVKELSSLKDSKEGEKLAFSVLAVLYACNGKIARHIGKYGDAIIKLLTKWGGGLVEIERGSINLGRFIKKSYNFFKNLLENLGGYPSGVIETGIKMHELISKLVRETKIPVEVNESTLSARAVKTGAKKGPDLKFELYKVIEVGIPRYEILGEIKCIKNGKELNQSIDQIEKYANEKPLVVIVAVDEDKESAEVVLDKLKERLPITYILYPRVLIEPLTLVEDPYVCSQLFTEALGKSFESDLSFAINSLIVRTSGFVGIDKSEILAKQIVDRLKSTSPKNVRFTDVRKKLDKDLGSKAENVAKEILEMLTKRGFLERKSERMYISQPGPWREKYEEATKDISEMIKKAFLQIGQPLTAYF
jgi:ABC-type oligopeptide transport system ATPase subunit